MRSFSDQIHLVAYHVLPAQEEAERRIMKAKRAPAAAGSKPVQRLSDEDSDGGAPASEEESDGLRASKPKARRGVVISDDDD